MVVYMKQKRGYTVLELVLLLAIITVGMVVTILATSYAFDNKKEEAYQSEISNILRGAVRYGESIKDNIKDSKDGIIVSVEKLVETGFIPASAEDGQIYDPRNGNQSLNDLKVRIVYNEKNDKVTAEEYNND